MRNNTAGITITMEPCGPMITLTGTPAQILAAWGYATFAVSRRLNIPEDVLAKHLPEIIARVRRGIQSTTAVDLTMPGGKGGGIP